MYEALIDQLKNIFEGYGKPGQGKDTKDSKEKIYIPLYIDDLKNIVDIARQLTKIFENFALEMGCSKLPLGEVGFNFKIFPLKEDFQFNDTDIPILKSKIEKLGLIKPTPQSQTSTTVIVAPKQNPTIASTSTTPPAPTTAASSSQGDPQKTQKEIDEELANQKLKDLLDQVAKGYEPFSTKNGITTITYPKRNRNCIFLYTLKKFLDENSVATKIDEGLGGDFSLQINLTSFLPFFLPLAKDQVKWEAFLQAITEYDDKMTSAQMIVAREVQNNPSLLRNLIEYQPAPNRTLVITPTFAAPQKPQPNVSEQNSAQSSLNASGRVRAQSAPPSRIQPPSVGGFTRLAKPTGHSVNLPPAATPAQKVSSSQPSMPPPAPMKKQPGVHPNPTISVTKHPSAGGQVAATTVTNQRPSAIGHSINASVPTKPPAPANIHRTSVESTVRATTGIKTTASTTTQKHPSVGSAATTTTTAKPGTHSSVGLKTVLAPAITKPSIRPSVGSTTTTTTGIKTGITTSTQKSGIRSSVGSSATAASKPISTKPTTIPGKVAPASVFHKPVSTVKTSIGTTSAASAVADTGSTAPQPNPTITSK